MNLLGDSDVDGLGIVDDDAVYQIFFAFKWLARLRFDLCCVSLFERLFGVLRVQLVVEI